MQRSKVQYGDAVIRDGFFLKRNAPIVDVNDYEDVNGTFFRHLSTFPERSTIKEQVIELIASAEQNIFFCNFLLQDHDVVEALIAAARRLSGHVYLITTLKSDDFAIAGANDLDEEQDFEGHIEFVKRLSSVGLPIKARSDCHAKFMTVDDSVAIVTSANAVPTCYGNVKRANGKLREANPENGVLLHTRQEVSRLANFFRAMWTHGSNYFVKPDAGVFEVQQIRREASQISSAEPTAPSSEGEVIWTAPSDPRICDRFVRMVQEAKHNLRISTWVIKGMENHRLGEAICDAADRGVFVDILVRGMNYRDDHRGQCYQLATAMGKQGRIIGDYWNHSKAVIVDSQQAMILSANMDAQHGLDNGVEVGFFSAQTKFIKAVEVYFSRLTSEAAFEMACDLTQAEIAERYKTRSYQELAGELKIVPDRSQHGLRKTLQKWMRAAETQLVKVDRDRKQKSRFTLSTDALSITGTLSKTGVFQVRGVNTDRRRVAKERFDSYLPATTLIAEAAN